MPYEDVEILTSDKIKLKGWLLKQKEPKNAPTVVFFHENAGNLGARLFYLQNYYQKVQPNILIVAYRGYDESEGQPNEPGIKKDCEAIMEYVHTAKDLDQSKIFLHGRSLGGATSIYSASLNKFPVKGLIVENTFISLENLVCDLLPPFKLFAKLLVRNKWLSIDTIKNVQCPILFIKSLKDELIHPKHMDQLYNSVGVPKQMYVIANGDHNSNWTVDMDHYFMTLSNFIANVLKNEKLQ